MRIRTERIIPELKLFFMGHWHTVRRVTCAARGSFNITHVYTIEFDTYPPVVAHPGETFEYCK